MNVEITPTILFVPGLREHVPGHWQTLLEHKLPKALSVPRMELDKLVKPVTTAHKAGAAKKR